jgi:hypothetical protein
MFSVELDMAAQSKSNYRRTRRSEQGAWGDLASFEDQLAMLVAPHVPDDWETGSPLEKVAKRPTVVAVVVARSPLDAANLSKSTLDAFEGLLYVTDAQVQGCATVGERGRTDQWLALSFAQLRPGSTVEETAAALAALVADWARRRTATTSS